MLENLKTLRAIGSSLVTKRDVTSIAPTDPVAAAVDELQRIAGDGPAVSVATQWSDRIVRTVDY